VVAFPDGVDGGLTGFLATDLLFPAGGLGLFLLVLAATSVFTLRSTVVLAFVAEAPFF